MKRITWLGTTTAAVAVVLAAGMSSCAKEKALADLLPEGEPCRLMLQAKTIDTKVNAERLSEGTVVGVHIVDRTSEETTTTAQKWPNLKHIANAQGGLDYQNEDPSGLPIILTTGYLYDVYSYSPYVEGLTAEGSSQIAVGHGVDVLWAKTGDQKPNDKTHTVDLEFEHKAAKVEFQVVADAASEPDITGATIKVTGFYKDGTLDLATGKITPGMKDETIELNQMGQAICFLPLEGEMELKVQVTVPEGSANAGTYVGSVKRTFLPGTSTEIKVTVIDRNSELGLTAGLVPWEEKTGNMDVNN
ncbi:MAG: fimbrillin family protein [Rikenella sp.]|nr:fimbrillin family protein [Rikenella sp.]